MIPYFSLNSFKKKKKKTTLVFVLSNVFWYQNIFFNTTNVANNSKLFQASSAESQQAFWELIKEHVRETQGGKSAKLAVTNW